MIMYIHRDVNFSILQGVSLIYQATATAVISLLHFLRVTLEIYKSLCLTGYGLNLLCGSFGLNLSTMHGGMGKFHLRPAFDQIQASIFFLSFF